MLCREGFCLMLGHHPLARHSALSWLRGGPHSSAPGSMEGEGMGRAGGVEGCGQAGLTQLLEVGESLMHPRSACSFPTPSPGPSAGCRQRAHPAGDRQGGSTACGGRSGRPRLAMGTPHLKVPGARDL